MCGGSRCLRRMCNRRVILILDLGLATVTVELNDNYYNDNPLHDQAVDSDHQGRDATSAGFPPFPLRLQLLLLLN